MNTTTSPLPFFTVIIATYNAEATVVKSLESVLAQTERPQIILVDGLSKDRTMALAQPFEAQGVELICERDEGVYDAWNKGIAKATGEWVIFLGADDYYDSPTCLATLRAKLTAADTRSDVAYGRVKVVDADGTIVAEENHPWEEVRAQLPVNMPFTHVGTAHRRTMFAQRKFNPAFRIAGDYHFLYPSLIKQSPLFIPDYVIHMGAGGLSTNPRTRRRLIREIKAVQSDYSINIPLRQKVWLDAKYAYYSVRNRLESKK
jgi:glycosyltransferase involved in cell wall biosynthesis